MPPSMIEINGLVKKYGDRVAVNGVSFCVYEGEIFGLLGSNGAGKTTTISILATLLPSDGGHATIAGYDLMRGASKIKPLIGFVPQELALYPTLSCWDNLTFFGRIYGLRRMALKERITAVLDLVGLRDRAGDAVRTFSGGMKETRGYGGEDGSGRNAGEGVPGHLPAECPRLHHLRPLLDRESDGWLGPAGKTGGDLPQAVGGPDEPGGYAGRQICAVLPH